MSEEVYFKNIHKNKKDNPHYFMCEELLVPRCQSADSQRINMFSNHLSQMVHLKTPEIPKVFTNFENQFGEYSFAHKEAEEEFVIIDKIWKNKYNYLLIIQYTRSKKYDVIMMRNCENISESYGYEIVDCIKDKEIGDIVSEGQSIYHAHDFDNEVYSYGVNLRAVFLPFFLMTYEDGIVISRSAADKLKSFKVETSEVSVNTNDIMLNLYGNDSIYKSFPKVGDHTTSKILLALRRIDYSKALYDLQTSRLKEVDPLNDDIIYTEGGKVVDIDFYSNISIDQLKKRNNEFSKELVAEIEAQYDFYKEVANKLEKIIPIRPKTQTEKKEEESPNGRKIPNMPIPKSMNKNEYSDDLAYWWKISHEYIDPNIKWREEGKTFENVKIKFTLLKENPLVEGCKISGRYGNKGVISRIEDDENMPLCKETGLRAEIALNPLGVVNRLNPAQLQEQYINFMTDHLIAYLKTAETLEEKEEEFFKFMKIINKNEADFLELEYIPLNRQQKEEFFQDIINEGIYIHQYPFFGNVDMEGFKKLFIEMPELCSEYHFEGIERTMVMGDIYFIRLKHESQNKSSVRSTSMTNVRNLPAKNTLKKSARALTSTTPIRLGEMETTNLFVAKRPDLVEKMLKYYSTSEDARSDLVEELLTENDPFNLNLPEVEEKSINRQILDKYLNILDLELENRTPDD